MSVAAAAGATMETSVQPPEFVLVSCRCSGLSFGADAVFAAATGDAHGSAATFPPSFPAEVKKPPRL